MPGVAGCERWIGADNPKISVVTYDLDNVDVLKSDAYNAIGNHGGGGANLSAWSKRVTARIKMLMRFEGEQIAHAGGAAPKEAPALLLNAMSVAPEHERDGAPEDTCPDPDQGRAGDVQAGGAQACLEPGGRGIPEPIHHGVDDILGLVSFLLGKHLEADFAARPSDRLDKRLVANVGGAGFIFALAVFIGSHSLAGAVVATLVAGLGWGVFLVADWAIACRVLPAGAMAAAMGVWNLAVVGPQIVAPFVTTLVLQRFALAGAAAPRVAFALALG